MSRAAPGGVARLLLWIAVTAVIPAQAQTSNNTGHRPNQLHCGAIVKTVVSAGPIVWTSDASGTGRTAATSVEREPTADAHFVMLTVRVAMGRSLGRVDYAIRARGRLFPCLALRTTGADFNREARSILADDRAYDVDLLFEVPNDVESAAVVLVLPVTVPQAPSDLDLTAAAVYDPGQSF